MPRIPFALQSYRHRSVPVSAQRLINWFPEQEPRDAKAPVICMPTPGLVEFFEPEVGALTRGLHVMGSYLYGVIGQAVWRIDVNGDGLNLGNITSGGAVSMDDNGLQLVIVVPETGEAWVVTTSTLTQISDPDFLGATAVTCVDGFHVFSRPNSTQFFISDLNDATAYDPLAFASAEGSPDNLIAPMRVGRELWLFGERSTEIWSNTGGSPMPFSRITGAYVDRGIAARFSLATRNNQVLWLGEDRVVYRNDGANPTRISTHAIEQAFAGYDTVSDARGWIYEQEGHSFYVLHFPDAGDTWVYDIATQSWHERESEGYGTWRCIDGTPFAGAIIGGDAQNGRLYVIDPTVSDELGDPIIRTAIGPVAQNEGRRMSFHSVEVDMETGVGLQTGQGSDPVVWLSYSDDAGRTWSNQIERPLGRVGKYRNRVIFNRLGMSRARVLKLEMSDPVRTTLIAANIDAEPER